MGYSETDTCWHLMVKTHGGKVSMLQNLDAPTARQAFRRLCPETHPCEYINIPKGGISWSGAGRTTRDGDIRSVEIFGPEGEELHPWRGVQPHIIDLEPERKRQEEQQAAAERRRIEAEQKAVGLGVIKDISPILQSRPFRCCQCGVLQPSGSIMYYLPDQVSRKDDVTRIKEVIRASRFNGHGSGWCADCAPKEPRAKKPAVANVCNPIRDPSRKWWHI